MSASYFSGIFGASPIKPMQKHMYTVHECVSKLVPFVKAAIQHDLDSMQNFQQQITDYEHQADSLKKEIRLHLPNRLFMPVSRRDLLEVLSMQDDIANKAKDIAGLMLGRKMQLPTAIADDFLSFIERSVDACEQARDSINELDELIETGFGNTEIAIIEKMLTSLDSIEADTDNMQITIRTKLFDLENELAPVETMFLYKIIDWSGHLADRAQQVGCGLQVMLAK